MPPAQDINSVLPALLAKLERPGDFCGSGAVELPVVRISVDGVGTLGLPIRESQCKAIGRVATPAPYGRGPDTIIDAKGRRCGQVPAENVQVDDPRWVRTLDRIVAHAAAALGVDGNVRADLYKLLVYEPGDFFTEHRDTEKAPGMFATLVVVLPSDHAGGELVVRHDGREATLDLAEGDLGVARWAAFYADCQHELRPVRSGYRVALVYNLVRPKGRALRVPDVRPDIARVAKALRSWGSATDASVKLVYPLKHQYSLAELAFGALKNEDAAAADVLTEAAEEAGCVLRLAMVSIEESGSAEPIWDGRRSSRRGSYRGDDEDEGEENESYEVTEVHDRSQVHDGWRRPDDSLEPLGPIPYESTTGRRARPRATKPGGVRKRRSVAWNSSNSSAGGRPSRRAAGGGAFSAPSKEKVAPRSERDLGRRVPGSFMIGHRSFASRRARGRGARRGPLSRGLRERGLLVRADLPPCRPGAVAGGAGAGGPPPGRARGQRGGT